MWIVRIDRKTGMQVGKPTRCRSEREVGRTFDQIKRDDLNGRAPNPNQKAIREYFREVGVHRYHVTTVPEGKSG